MRQSHGRRRPQGGWRPRGRRRSRGQRRSHGLWLATRGRRRPAGRWRSHGPWQSHGLRRPGAAAAWCAAAIPQAPAAFAGGHAARARGGRRCGWVGFLLGWVQAAPDEWSGDSCGGWWTASGPRGAGADRWGWRSAPPRVGIRERPRSHHPAGRQHLFSTYAARSARRLTPPTANSANLRSCGALARAGPRAGARRTLAAVSFSVAGRALRRRALPTDGAQAARQRCGSSMAQQHGSSMVTTSQERGSGAAATWFACACRSFDLCTDTGVVTRGRQDRSRAAPS